MGDVTTTTEHAIDEGERRAERDLGAIINEVEHLTAQLAEHTTTIEGLRSDKEWMIQRFEAIERDLLAIPKVPEELTRSVSDSIAQLSTRLERVEATTSHEEETLPPPRRESRNEGEDDHRDDERHERRSLLDHLF